jgi:2-phospho-L-lactate guanylyltransferase (CobY/MobA/RfbA family)
VAMNLPGVERVVLATPGGEISAVHPDLPVMWDHDSPGEAFHFGRRLAGLMRQYPDDVHVYLGAGSLPLLSPAVLAGAVDEVSRSRGALAVTNNLYSSDWMVLNCSAAVQARPERLATDNALGWVLKTEAAVEVRSLPASAGTRLDIDTPADLLLLAMHPRTGPALEDYLRNHPFDSRRWQAVGRRLFAAGGQVALIGRVSSSVWRHVETQTQAWIRVFSEERGMTASGRLAAGQVKSLIGAHLSRRGPAAFFEELDQMVEAVVFDTRPVLAHARRWPSAADRYASDLGLVEQIADPFLRDLTAAAVSAPIPVVLGGHGVVAGDLYGLVEIAGAGGLADGGAAGAIT